MTLTFILVLPKKERCVEERKKDLYDLVFIDW